MHLQILGLLTEPTWWYLNRVPPGGGVELTQTLRETLGVQSQLEFYFAGKPLDDYKHDDLVELWTTQPAHIVAKPVGSRQQSVPDTKLRLVTTSGPDAGRVFPLTRGDLSVGRASARAQVRDPWLSGHDFDVRLSSKGTWLAPVDTEPRLWNYGEAVISGSTSFELRRGPGRPLHAPRDPGDFEIAPGQPPSPPNLVLQVIGAAAPLLIGVVLMLVTGMWYFLLFSGVSVIIAAVLITQHRRSRSRYLANIEVSLEAAADSFRASVFSPDELIGAISNSGADPLDLDGLQTASPLLNIGTGIRKASIAHLQESERWQPFLSHRVNCVLRLEPGCQTVIVGDPTTRRPIENWLTAQIMRHTKATGTGFRVDDVHLGGRVLVEIIKDAAPAVNHDQHHLIFAQEIDQSVDANTTIVNLNTGTVDGAVTSTGLAPYGISRQTLRWLSKELLFDRPTERSQLEHLNLTERLLEGTAVHQLLTTVGVGKLGLSIDIVRDGPHVLITGTTGSGKSELLLTVLVGLAHRYAPCEMSLILLDFKGGSSFNVLKSLPHTMAVETNHVAASSFRSLEAIAAELYRRETLFAQHHVADFEAFRQAFPHRALPRLVVAIDELRILVDQNTEAATTLSRLAATGRSLGFHLIVATQRTQGAVNADIRANIGSTIALRTATEHDSWDVLGTADAFRISPKTPGRAYFKAGAEAPRLFHTARYTLDDEPIVLVPHQDNKTTETGETTDWDLVVNKLRQYAETLPRPQPVILPALTVNIDVAALRHRFGTDASNTPIGQVDDPSHCRQYPVALGMTGPTSDTLTLTASVAWVGAVDSGIEASLSVVCEHVLASNDHKILFEGRRLTASPSGWDRKISFETATGDVLKNVFDELSTRLASGLQTTLVITEWGSWVNALVTGSFQGFEERLIQVMRLFTPTLKVYVFGSRELAGGRLLAMIPDRFYIPKNSSAEHQLIWPTLRAIPPETGRAVLVTADHASGGYEVQLCRG